MSIYDDINAGKYENALPYSTDKGAAGSEIRLAFNAETARLEEIFRADLFRELGIEEHPKKDVLYRIAWERGHSSSYTDVASGAYVLVNLIREEAK